MKLTRSLPKNALLLRLKRLQKILSREKCEACLIDAPTDLFYLTGLKLSAGRLIVDGKQATLLVDGRYFAYAQKTSPVPVLLQQEHSLSETLEKNKVKTLGFDGQKTSYDEVVKLKKTARPIKLLSLSSPLREVRMVKDNFELRALKKSADLLWQGFQHIKTRLKMGITEKEVAFELELFCRKRGAEKMAFDPIIAFGSQSAMPHHRAGDTRLKRGDLVLVDIGIVVDNYHSDMTRTLFFGQSDPFLRTWQNIVKQSFQAALDVCAPGVSTQELDRAARRVMRKESVEEYFIHSLGHGIGLETHEFPRVSSKAEDVHLQPGMVITIEPGLYLPGKGGVRYEDTVIVTEKGCKSLYPDE